MSQIDWSKAPEGAEYRDGFNDWYKIGDSGLLMAWYRNAGQWNPSTRPGPYADWHRKPAPTEWNGTGRPPAGTVCEFREYCGTWAECTIIGEFKGRIICGCNATGTVGYIDLEELRPIRTHEQIAADEREAAIDGLIEFFVNYYGNPKGSEQYMLICRSLHDAGYRKQSTCDPTGCDD